MRPQDVGALPLGAVSSVVGVTPVHIGPTPDSAHDVIILSAAKGNFNIASGDRTLTMPSGELPTISDLAGNGTLYLREGVVLALSMPSGGLTVRGYASDSVINFWFC